MTEDQKRIRDACREIAEENYIKRSLRSTTRKARFPWDIVEVPPPGGHFGGYIPEDTAGFGGGVLEMAIAVEELSAWVRRHCPRIGSRPRSERIPFFSRI